MNNDLNTNNIETLDDNIETLDENVVENQTQQVNTINQVSSVQATNNLPPVHEQSVLPNGEINVGQQVANNVENIVETETIQNNPYTETKHGFKLDITSIVILIGTLLSHFLLVPHVILKLYVNIVEKILSTGIFQIKSTFALDFLIYLFVVPVLTLLLTSFCMIAFGIFNVIYQGEKSIELWSFFRKTLLYTFFISIGLLLLLQFTNTDFVTPVIRIVTFNGYQLTLLG